jgi:predicted SPOUT superfamily RNA methylase MTH1
MVIEPLSLVCWHIQWEFSTEELNDLGSALEYIKRAAVKYEVDKVVIFGSHIREDVSKRLTRRYWL